VETYGDTAIIHITGGEPSIVGWLYPYLEANGHKYRFHLNTNAFIMPPASSIRRLKVSLDSCQRDYWNELVGRPAFDRVIANIQAASKQTVTSITYTLTKENYKAAPEFVRFANATFPDLYALFFSSYKGTNPRFVFTGDEIENFFGIVMPELDKLLSEESRALLHETLGDKLRLIAGTRFPQNDLSEPCYLSMTERVIAPDGNEYACSHLYRDGILTQIPEKHERCLYGCNQRLVDFNKCASERLKERCNECCPCC
jgi:sulfatase maturation enzyme AslB (radical SAM superfamily)